MNWKPVLSVAAVAAVATLTGCTLPQPNNYASIGEYGIAYDLQQQPVPGLTVAESERIAEMPTATVTQLLPTPMMVPAPVPQTSTPGTEGHASGPPPAPESKPATPPTTPQ
jgi:hypothetical protein